MVVSLSVANYKMPNKNRPILITGAHRSGTTWIGNMIAKSKQVCYIKEPFSIKHRPGVCSAKFDYHFTYINSENEAKYFDQIQDTINLKYKLRSDLESIREFSHIKKLLKNYYTFQKGKVRNARALFKDPISIFSSDWLCNRFGFQVVVLVRHPAAFASSVKRLGLYHPFSNFLNQPLLMNQFPIQYKRQIENFTSTQLENQSIKNPDIIDQIILLWNLIYSYVITMTSKHPDWLIVRHEDISLNPQKYFKQIFEYLSLEYDEKILNKILSYSDANNPPEIKKHHWQQ